MNVVTTVLNEEATPLVYNINLIAQVNSTNYIVGFNAENSLKKY
jgi:hypothetical protein